MNRHARLPIWYASACFNEPSTAKNEREDLQLRPREGPSARIITL